MLSLVVLDEDSNGINRELHLPVKNKELCLYLLIQWVEVLVQRDDPK